MRAFEKVKQFVGKLSAKKVAVATLSGALIASTLLNSFSSVSASPAYADEAGQVVVSLVDTENGHLAFPDSDAQSVTVAAGSDVTINAVADDGYFADSLSVFASDGSADAVDLTDGSATFAVSEDVSVTTSFYENGSLGSAALVPVTVDEDVAPSWTSVEDYVRAHADANYVGTLGDDGTLERKDVLMVTATSVDSNELATPTLDGLWADEDGDGVSDNWTALRSQALSQAVLFELDPDSDYYVGWVGASISGASLTDWGAAENNANAIMRDGFVVDDTTGLVYVPKRYTEVSDEGEPIVGSSRIQLLYATADKAATASFDLSTSVVGTSGDVVDEGTVSVPLDAVSTKVVIAKDDAARASISEDTIDSVEVNGIEYTRDLNTWSYDAETGTLEFDMSPAGVHAMRVNLSNTLSKSAASLANSVGSGLASVFGATIANAALNNLGATWTFPSMPYEGQTFVTKGHNTYKDGGISGYIDAGLSEKTKKNGSFEMVIAQQAMGWATVDDTSAWVTGSSIERTAEIYQQTVDGITIPEDVYLNLICSHIGIDENFNETDIDFQLDEPSDDWGQHVRVFSVSGNKAIISVVVPTQYGQAGSGFFEITWKLSVGHLNLKKTSSNPSITDGNACYSLEGATFDVINSEGVVVGSFSTDANGDTGTMDLQEGTYTVRETSAPAGYWSVGEQTVTVTAGQSVTVTFADPPGYDPMSMVVGKYDGEREYIGSGNLPQGSASLAGAEFTVEYYDTLSYGNYDELKGAGVSPKRSWVVSTDEDGFAYLVENYLVSGDALYYQNGIVSLPRGTVVVYESKAPIGYELADDRGLSFQKIQETTTGSTGNVYTYNIPQVPEPVMRGGVTVVKTDAELSDETDAQGDGSLAGISYDIINKSEQSVVVDGAEHAPNTVATTITTAKVGDHYEASTTIDALPYGSYEIRENTSGQSSVNGRDCANNSYLNAGWSKTFDITEDGQRVTFDDEQKNINQVIRGGLTLTKFDRDLHRSEAEGDSSLEGATFDIVNKSTNADGGVVKVDGTEYGYDEVVKTITTERDALGNYVAATGQYDLPYGTYEVHETKTSDEGYLFDATSRNWSKTFSIREDGKIHHYDVDGEALTNQVIRGGLKLTKFDREIDRSEAQGDASLDGIQFAIINRSDNVDGGNVYVDGGTYAWGRVVKVITTERVSDGETFAHVAQTANDSLPYGTYEIREVNPWHAVTAGDVWADTNQDDYDGTATGTGATTELGRRYLYDKQSHDWKQIIEIRENGKIVEKNTDGKSLNVDESDGGVGVSNQVIRGGVKLTKFDRELQRSFALGAASLEGVTFDIVNKSVNSDNGVVLVDGKEYGYDEVVKTITTKRSVDSEGNVSYVASTADDANATTDDTLPYGTYALQETRSGEGYLINDTVYTFSIVKDGEIVDGGDSGTVPNQVIRGDLEFSKKTGVSAEHMAGVPFKLTSTTTGESHVIVTDENGYFSSASEWNKHTVDTNANDWALDETGVIDSSQLNSRAGTWFGVDTTADDELNALPYDTYIIDELRCSANEGYQLVTDASIIVSRDGVTIDLGTIDDPEAHVITNAWGSDFTDKSTVGEGETVVHDTVSYGSLIAGRNYKLVTELHDSETGEIINGSDGEPITVETLFRADASYGVKTVDVLLSTVGLGDKSITVFEKLYDNGGSLVASHVDKDDVSQQVKVIKPKIGTKAKDAVDGDKNVVADPEASIIDTVAFKNLLVGQEYKLSGVLYDKATGEPLLVNGETVSAETTFTPEEADGRVAVTFEFDASAIDGGTSLVSFESLSLGGVELTTHADIEDEGQTVTVTRPEIGTTATDGVDGDKTVVADKKAVITDAVAYRNLVPGKEYVLTGTLYDKTTGLPLVVNNGQTMVAAQTVFTPETASGSVDVVFEFDASAIPDDTSVVAFESLSRIGTEVAAHADIEDEDQTVVVKTTKIATLALDGLSASKIVVADAESSVTDEVSYEQALPDADYTLSGILVDADSGLPILTKDGSEKYSEDDLKAFVSDLLVTFGFGPDDSDDSLPYLLLDSGFGATETTEDGDIDWDATENVPADVDANKVKAFTNKYADLLSYVVYDTREFTPEKAEGNVTMDFSFDSNAVIDRLGGETKNVVVFEVLSKGSFESTDDDATLTVVASECDSTNEDQTVTLLPSAISTTATDKADGDHELDCSDGVSIVDKVEYENLIPGKEYQLKATLYDKDTGEPLVVNGKTVTANLRFTPNSANGFVEIELGEFDASELGGHDLVVFEELYKQTNGDDILVAEHKDIDDGDQTVHVVSPEHVSLQTGLVNGGILVALSVVIACGVAGLKYWTKRHPIVS